MTRSTSSGNDLSPEGSAAAQEQGSKNGRDGRTTGKSLPAMPSISFLLLTLAVIAAGTGALTWALVRPDPRGVEIIIPTPGPLVVHVTGSVSNPGVYTLPPGSRVSEAVEAAGGLIGPSSVNLAAPLRDGQQVMVPEVATAVPVVSAPGDSGSVDRGTDQLLDLNTASPGQLEQLPGIGPTRAAAIVDFRERNGPVLFVDDLAAIDGIGTATVDGLRALVIQP